MIAVEDCRGCRNDFYNGPAALDGKRCWSAATGKMMTRYAIHYLQVPTQKGAYTKVRKPSCYHQVNALIFHNTLPDFVKAADLNRARRAQAPKPPGSSSGD
jgi:hypothetical protein